LTLAQEMGYECSAYDSVDESLKAARRLSQAGDLICVTGSIFVVGDLLNHWDGLKSLLWSE
jgi:folylpolyglutamate synthase/dihydropteroate synthase